MKIKIKTLTHKNFKYKNQSNDNKRNPKKISNLNNLKIMMKIFRCKDACSFKIIIFMIFQIYKEHYNCQMEKYIKASQTIEYSMNKVSTTNEKYNS